MKKVSIISACTDLGLKIDGAELGAQVLTNDLKSSNISHNYVLKGNKKDEESNSSSDSNDINSFVSKFDDLLLDMHEIHFEENMNDEEKDAYYTKMHNLVLAVKALDSKNEKRNLEGINEFNERLYNTTRKVIQDGEFPLLVGGDHIVAIGSSLGSIKENKNMGIIWFDSHADFNTYPTSVTGNLHGLPLAVATHYEKSILSDFHDGPFYNFKNAVIVGGRDIDPWEWGNVLDAGVTVFSTEDIKNMELKKFAKRLLLLLQMELTEYILVLI